MRHVSDEKENLSIWSSKLRTRFSMDLLLKTAEVYAKKVHELK